MTPCASQQPELRDLIDAICESEPAAAAVEQLEALLLADEDACRFYLDYVSLHNALTLAAEQQYRKAEGGKVASGEWLVARKMESSKLTTNHSPLTTPSNPQSPIPNPSLDSAPAIILDLSSPLSPLPSPLYSTHPYLFSNLIAALVMCAAVFGAWLYEIDIPQPVAQNDQPAMSSAKSPEVEKIEYVGRITGMVDVKWGEGSGFRGQGSGAMNRDSSLSTIHYPLSTVSLGDKFALTAGLLEITYNAGAKVILQGPVMYESEANGGFLSVGKLTGKLGTKAEGGRRRAEESNPQSLIPNPSSLSTIHYPLFTIKTPTATVTDLGTEFGVDVNKEGITETQVFAGAVQIASAGKDDLAPQTQIVRAGNAVRCNGTNKPFAATKSDHRRFVRVLQPRAETEADAYAKQVLALQPVAYYRMEPLRDAKAQDNVFDSAPGGHHGAVCRGNEYSMASLWGTGHVGRALHLEGDSYALVRNLPGSDTQQLSVSAWVYVWQGNNWGVIASQHDTSTYDESWKTWDDKDTWQFHLGLFGDSGDVMVNVNQRNRQHRTLREGAANPLPLVQWQHIAIVADGSVLHLYRNGVEVASTPCDGVCATPPIKHLTIGCKSMNGSPNANDVKPEFFWRGSIDELAIFNRALSAVEVRQLYDGATADASKAPRTAQEKN